MSGVTAPPRIVLDTNVCLDLLRFGDPRTAALRAALEAGEVVAVTDEACRDEWLRVLDYPLLRLDDVSREAMIAAFDAVAQPLPQATRREPAALPRCRDPDDQKFLQLAHASGARWLLSRDRHLLSLAKRCRREGWFEIKTPEAWTGSDRSLSPKGTSAAYNSNRYDSFTSNCSLSRRRKLSTSCSCGSTENASSM